MSPGRRHAETGQTQTAARELEALHRPKYHYMLLQQDVTYWETELGTPCETNM